MLSPLQKKIFGRRSAAEAWSDNIEARSSLNLRNLQSDLGKLSEIKKRHSKLAKYEYIVSSQKANKKTISIDYPIYRKLPCQPKQELADNN